MTAPRNDRWGISCFPVVPAQGPRQQTASAAQPKAAQRVRRRAIRSTTVMRWKMNRSTPVVNQTAARRVDRACSDRRKPLGSRKSPFGEEGIGAWRGQRATIPDLTSAATADAGGESLPSWPCCCSVSSPRRSPVRPSTSSPSSASAPPRRPGPISRSAAFSPAPSQNHRDRAIVIMVGAAACPAWWRSRRRAKARSRMSSR